MAEWVNVDGIAALPPGSCLRADVDGDDVLIVNVDGTVYAIDNICSHEYAELSDGELHGQEIECPLHGARFDVTTGEALTPPAYDDVRTYEVRVEDDVIQVKVPD